MLSLRKPIVTGTAACVLILAALCPPADARSRRAACKDYASEAVAQYERNIRLRCGFEGPRWSGERRDHFVWCLDMPREARVERDARHRMVEDCAARRRSALGGARHARCDTYAKIATVQANAAERYDCDFQGPEWRSDSNTHYRWCMSARRKYIIDQVRYRAADLQKCFDALGEDDDGRPGREGRDRY